MTVHLIGCNHVGKDFFKLNSDLTLRATRRELAYGAEGLVRDDSIEFEFISGRFYKERGYFRGLEDEFSFVTGKIINYYAIFAGAYQDDLQEQRELTAKTGMFCSLASSKVAREIWSGLDRKILTPQASKLKGVIDSSLKLMQDVPLVQIAQMFRQVYKTGPSGLTETRPWLDLTRPLTQIACDRMSKLPKSDRPNVGGIQKYLKNIGEPNTTEDESGILITARWRDGFMVKNAGHVIEVGETNEVDTYLLVGELHYDGMMPKLQEQHPDLEIRGARSESSIPDEYRHLALN